MTGFSSGFSLSYSGPRLPTNANNLKSVKGKELIVEQKIKKELDEGRIGGPFVARPFVNLRVSQKTILKEDDEKN